MSKFLLPFLLLISLLSFGQKTYEGDSPLPYKSETCRSYFNKILLEGKLNEETVTNYLKKNFTNFSDYRTGLKLKYINQSPGGFHYSFTQTFNGVAIYQSEIKVNIDRRNTIFAIFDNSENTSEWKLATSGAGPNTIIAINKQKNIPVLCERRVTDDGRELLIAQGEVIYEHDLKAYANIDSLVTGKVFNPDPLTTAQRSYRLPYVDDNDQTNASLDAQMQTVSFNATFNDSVFLLESAFLKISEFSAPNIQPVTSTNGQFYYNRAQEGFEDVNAFYHISAIQNHVHQLGFNSADSLVEVDTHASNEDNSYFLPSPGSNKIFLGTGGVDDAEDADVCVHEYGHFVSATAAPGTNNGTERESLDEAFGDYLAASYSRSLSGYQDNWVFNWDGHNGFWAGRVMDSNGQYPADITGSKYRNAQIWSAALFSLNSIIGRNATDSLILQAHYSYESNISFLDAGRLLMYADTLLTNGKYACPIYSCLFAHGMQPSNPIINCTVGINETENTGFRFFSDVTSFSFINTTGTKFKLQLIDLTGRQIMQVDENQPVFNYENTNLPSGIYLVSVQMNGTAKTYKWVKAN